MIDLNFNLDAIFIFSARILELCFIWLVVKAWIEFLRILRWLEWYFDFYYLNVVLFVIGSVGANQKSLDGAIAV